MVIAMKTAAVITTTQSTQNQWLRRKKSRKKNRPTPIKTTTRTRRQWAVQSRNQKWHFQSVEFRLKMLYWLFAERRVRDSSRRSEQRRFRLDLARWQSSIAAKVSARHRKAARERCQEVVQEVESLYGMVQYWRISLLSSWTETTRKQRRTRMVWRVLSIYYYSILDSDRLAGDKCTRTGGRRLRKRTTSTQWWRWWRWRWGASCSQHQKVKQGPWWWWK